MLDLLKKAFNNFVEGIKKSAEKPSDKVNIVKKAIAKIAKIKLSEREIDAILDDLEWSLLEADVAVDLAAEIREKLTALLSEKEFTDIDREVKEIIRSLLLSYFVKPFEINPTKKPYVIAFFGTNGSGKTTTIAKIAYLLKKRGYSVVISASDTFRAGAIEQLETHAKRLNVPIVKGQYGSDPTAVAYDAVNYAKSRNIDVVLIDTAGRQEVNLNLMRQLEKLVRVIKPDLKIYVVESTVGNAGYNQLKRYSELIGIDAVIITKFDLDAKGGIALSVGRIANAPIIYVGVGQEYEDLKPFNPEEFVNAVVG
jgi:fused signal recognition particle receptor